MDKEIQPAPAGPYPAQPPLDQDQLLAKELEEQINECFRIIFTLEGDINALNGSLDYYQKKLRRLGAKRKITLNLKLDL